MFNNIQGFREMISPIKRIEFIMIAYCSGSRDLLREALNAVLDPN